jgi:hypothetical protein
MRFFLPMLGSSRTVLCAGIFLDALALSALSCIPIGAAQAPSSTQAVELVPIDVDAKDPERKRFGALTLLSAFQIKSKDPRFGGLSGLSVDADGALYAISDRGYWLSARIVTDGTGALVDLIDWRIAPMLATRDTPVTGSLRDAEALARGRDGSFLVAFEGVHRVGRYSPPPKTFASIPTPVRIPPAVAHAPRNGGIEALAALPDGRLLALTEEFKNPDRSFKGWIIEAERFAELSYIPADGFRVTDSAALDNGDVLVLERRYVLFGILSARLTLVKANDIQPGARLAGKELLRLEQPLAAENFEAVTVQETIRGTVIYLVSDDNYSSFQHTVLLQLFLPNAGH